MLWGVLLTVLLMVARPPLETPTFLTNSFDGFKAACPAKADCWMAEVAMTHLTHFFFLFFFSFFLFFFCCEFVSLCWAIGKVRDVILRV